MVSVLFLQVMLVLVQLLSMRIQATRPVSICSQMHSISTILVCQTPWQVVRRTWAGLQCHEALPLARKHAQRVQASVRRLLEALGDGVVSPQCCWAPAWHVGARHNNVVVPGRLRKAYNQQGTTAVKCIWAQQLLVS